MQTVVVVSKCLRLFDGGKRGDFHFKGFYSGEEIRRLHLWAGDVLWEKNREYVVYVKVMAMNEGTLTGQALKSRPLDEWISRC